MLDYSTAKCVAFCSHPVPMLTKWTNKRTPFLQCMDESHQCFAACHFRDANILVLNTCWKLCSNPCFSNWDVVNVGTYDNFLVFATHIFHLYTYRLYGNRQPIVRCILVANRFFEFVITFESSTKNKWKKKQITNGHGQR